jgi:hypothetical protein
MFCEDNWFSNDMIGYLIRERDFSTLSLSIGKKHRSIGIAIAELLHPTYSNISEQISIVILTLI